MNKPRQAIQQTHPPAALTLTLFLAGSLVELEEERKAVLQFVKRKNKELAKNNQNIVLITCEELSGQAQKEFNKKIKYCDIFILLFHNKVGENTKEEYEIAWKLSHLTPGHPIIRIFKKPESLPSSKENVLQYLHSKWVFEEKCEKRKHYPKIFSDNRNLILEIRKVITDYFDHKF